jgi:hydrogenase nickel incorporation protein HypB
MCTVCGCGQGETRIEGEAHTHRQERAQEHAHEHVHEHEHEHVHADGTVHRHAHGHAHSHAHIDHDHAHDERELHGHDAHGLVPAHDHDHAGDLHYGLGPAHAHAPGLSQERMVRIERDILGKNDAYAADNRRVFGERGIFAVNLVSSPGSGKTTLLVRTIEALRGELPIAVVEGDQQTSQDADRIRATGAPAIQVNTGKGCHLDAHMVGHAVEHLHPAQDSLLMIENVGNLVCPAAFDLGEAHKVVILSVTEGEDKPLKYPDMFHAASLMLLNKIDLLPHVAFDVARCEDYARRVNPRLRILHVSATSGEGMAAWLDWLREGLAAARARRQDEVAALRRRIAELEARLAEK